MSIFAGLMLSLASTGVIGQAMGGLVLMYSRALKPGDYVRIDEVEGTVVELSLLSTKIRTPKREWVTLPNAVIVGKSTKNFSRLADGPGVILYTTVTIGYDVPWKKVHDLLIAAARATENVLAEPGPFVRQTSLDDFYVSYQINLHTNKADLMSQIYSDLHQHIQDQFHEAGVEILSPHYAALRDGNQVAIPEGYLPATYTPPSFRVTSGGAAPGAPHEKSL